MFLLLFSNLWKILCFHFRTRSQQVFVLLYFLKISLSFLVSPLKYTPFLLTARENLSFSPMQVKWKLGQKILWIFWRISSLCCVCLPHNGWVCFWDGSWWQWLLRQNERDGHVLHKQDCRRREALSRYHVLSQAGSQQLHDCCRCGVFPGAMGGDEWYKGRNMSAYRTAEQPGWTATNLGVILSDSAKDRNITGHMASIFDW